MKRLLTYEKFVKKYENEKTINKKREWKETFIVPKKGKERKDWASFFFFSSKKRLS